MYITHNNFIMADLDRGLLTAVPKSDTAITFSDIKLSIFCLCSDDQEDILWTKTFLQSIKDIGMEDVSSTIDTEVGYRQGVQLKTHLQSVNRLVIVLSPSSTENMGFMNTVECSIILIFKENKCCRIVPVLLTEDTELPFSLLNREPFLTWKEDMRKLVHSFFDTDEHLKSYVYNIINLFQKGQYLLHLNKCILPPDVSRRVKELGSSVLEWWGLHLSNNRLAVHMNKLQMIGSSQKILLYDMFTGLFVSEEIQFIRVTGFDNFNYAKFKGQKDLFDDLVNLYIAFIDFFSKNQERGTFWYNYRRHGISHTANLAIFPLSKAITCVHLDKQHSPNFSTLESRMDTFQDFPLECAEYRRKLAEAGFFHFGYLDYVQCFSCGGCMRTWALNRNPVTRHSTLFPMCPHIKELNEKTSEQINIDNSSNPDPSTSQGEGHRPNDRPIHDAKSQSPTHYNKNYCDFKKRFLSLQKFKQSARRTDIDDSVLQKYAEAGFYNYGNSADILCFSCNLGLTEFDQNVNPLQVHASLSSTCPHILGFEDKPKTIEQDPIDAVDILSESYIEYEFKSHE